MLPVQVEVIMPLPEEWGVCLSCEILMAQAEMDTPSCTRGLDGYPSEWQAEFRRFSDALYDLSMRYGDTVMFRVFDPRSLQGLFKAIRYAAHRYPTFVVAGEKKVVGLDMSQLEQTLLAAGGIVQPEHSIAGQP
jgi:hypothetical protein